MSSQYKENDTFRFGEDYSWNACVGENGHPDMYTYQQGYQQATAILIQACLDPAMNIDELVYPTIYSARHTLELFLKRQILLMSDLWGFSDKKPPNYAKITHSISDLSDAFMKLAKIDARYEPLTVKLEGLFSDFIEKDDTGQTFRYPQAVDSEQHLTSLYCINMKIFQDRFSLLCSYFDDYESITVNLHHEYRTKTTVCGLPRNDIETIARLLPQRSDWISPSFSVVKGQVCEKYNISSNTFKKVLDRIQAHPEFASIIGKECPIGMLSVGDLRSFIDILDSFDKLSGDGFLERKHACIQLILESIGEDSIRALAALWTMSYHHTYTEEYHNIVDYDKQSTTEDLLFDKLLLNPRRTLHRIEESLSRMGQTSLLAAFSKASE